MYDPGGAFYLWVDVGDEGEGWVRISLGNSEQAIRAGVSVLADTVGALTGPR